MRKCIVNHNSIKLSVKGQHLSITADYIVTRVLSFSLFHHFGRNVNTRNRCDLPFLIIGKKYACTAGNIKDIYALTDSAFVKNLFNYLFITLLKFIPAVGVRIKERNNIVFIHNNHILLSLLLKWSSRIPSTSSQMGLRLHVSQSKFTVFII